MKKLLLCTMIGIFAVCYSACGNDNTVDTDKLATPSKVSGAATTDEESTAPSSTAVASPEAAATAPIVADVPDFTAATDAATTSVDQAVPLGEWAQTAIYSVQDETYRAVYVRVVKVTTQSLNAEYVDSVIQTNNIYGQEEDQVDPDEMEIEETSELVVVDYDVYIPEDFPAPGYGMPEPKLILSTREIGESGMGLTTQLVVRDATETYRAGSTYRERSLYTMKRGKTNYVIAYSTYPVGTPGDETSADNMYTAYHSLVPLQTEAEVEEAAEETVGEAAEEAVEETAGEAAED